MQLVGRPDALTRRERQPRIYWPMNFISFHLISFQLAVVGLCCPSLSTRCSRSGHSVTISLYWDHGTNLTSISLVRRLAESSSASERFMWSLWKCGSQGVLDHCTTTPCDKGTNSRKSKVHASRGGSLDGLYSSGLYQRLQIDWPYNYMI